MSSTTLFGTIYFKMQYCIVENTTYRIVTDIAQDLLTKRLQGQPNKILVFFF